MHNKTLIIAAERYFGNLEKAKPAVSSKTVVNKGNYVCHRWKFRDDLRVLKGKLPDAELAKRFGNTLQAVHTRRWRLNQFHAQASLLPIEKRFYVISLFDSLKRK